MPTSSRGRPPFRLRPGASLLKHLLFGMALHSPVAVLAADGPALPIAYDRDYPVMAYSKRATRNAVARLEERLARDELSLPYVAARGYLDALLEALDISRTSQVLVFSKTSLQAPFINSRTPRALYFNDTTYVAWVQGSEHMEVVTLDEERGPVFYTVHNAPPAVIAFERETVRCMVCHDSAGLQPRGFPRVLVKSAPVEREQNPAGRVAPVDITQATALEDRWGGWYVTGLLGVQLHLGNAPLAGPPDATVPRIANRSNLAGLEEVFDTTPYLTARSDIVALLTFEHQSTVHNLITRAHYATLIDTGPDPAPVDADWSTLPAQRQAELAAVLEPLAQAMTFGDERRILGRMRGNAGFEQAFTARGPVDARGRTLREFDLTSRIFRYPLSYLVYTPQFDALPRYARQYLYGRFRSLLGAPSGNAALDRDRIAALEILADTKPESAGPAVKQRAAD